MEDPYYEYEFFPSSNGSTRKKRIRKRIPPGISDNDKRILQKVRAKCYRYDMLFSILGFNVGLSNIVNIIPVVGPLISTYWSFSVVMISRGLSDGLPTRLYALFFMNIVIDFALGLIPLVGFVITVAYKANSRNCLILERHIKRIGEMRMTDNDKKNEVHSRDIDNDAIKTNGPIENIEPASGNSISLLNRKLSKSSLSTPENTISSTVPTILNSSASAASTVSSICSGPDDMKPQR